MHMMRKCSAKPQRTCTHFCVKYLAEHALKLEEVLGSQAQRGGGGGWTRGALKSISRLSNQMILMMLVQRLNSTSVKKYFAQKC